MSNAGEHPAPWKAKTFGFAQGPFSDGLSGTVVRIPGQVQTSVTSRLWRGALFFFCVGLVALSVVNIPAVRPSQTVDASWATVLTYAHQHNLQFGSDLVFTYGPLGYLFTSDAPDYAAVVAFANVAFCGLIVYGLCRVALKLPIHWRVLPAVIFLLMAANIPSVSPDFIYLGLLCWGLLCLIEETPRLLGSVIILAALAAIGALIKVTCLVVALLSVAAITSDLILRKRVGLGCLLLSIFASLLLVGWLACGQSLVILPTFVASGFTMALGYSQSMGVEPPLLAVWPIILTVLVTAASILAFCAESFLTPPGNRKARRLILGGWLLAMLFLTWKQGIVRADAQHLVVFLEFASCLPLLLSALPVELGARRAWGRSLGVVACTLTIVAAQAVLYPLYLKVDRPLARFLENARTLLRPDSFAAERARATAWERRRADLNEVREAVGMSTVDSLGNNQSFAILNRMNYRPRPVFQSYAAFTLPLMRLNEEFYQSPRAPEYCLLNLSSIDGRLPVLEDSLALRDVLLDYKFVLRERSFLLLRKRAVHPPVLTLIKAGSVRAGDLIELRGQGETNLWLQVAVHPSLAGRIRQFLYQPARVRIAMWGPTSERRGAQFNGPVPMLASGFLASPLLLANEHAVDWCTGKPVIRPAGYSIEIDASERAYWQPEIDYKLYGIGQSTYD